MAEGLSVPQSTPSIERLKVLGAGLAVALTERTIFLLIPVIIFRRPAVQEARNQMDRGNHNLNLSLSAYRGLPDNQSGNRQKQTAENKIMIRLHNYFLGTKTLITISMERSLLSPGRKRNSL